MLFTFQNHYFLICHNRNVPSFESELMIFFFDRVTVSRKREREVERDRDRDRERDIFHLLIHSANAHNGTGWSQPGIQKLLLGLPCDCRGPRSCVILQYLPGHIAGSCIRTGATRSQTGAHMACKGSKRKTHLLRQRGVFQIFKLKLNNFFHLLLLTH